MHSTIVHHHHHHHRCVLNRKYWKKIGERLKHQIPGVNESESESKSKQQVSDERRFFGAW